MGEIAVRVTGLGKEYRLGRRERYSTLRDSLARAARAPARWLRRRARAAASEEGGRIWALRDVSFEVPRGEVVGVIGRNGAGKSTLLKVLSRVTDPTSGEVEVRGRVGSLLEVGTGFHPELTGRENIYLNGAVLGMRRAEIARNFDAIVAFAEVEQFLDTPVKHYSSGMYMRLAFAVAAHLEPEILVVDEVLAVGDAAFQKKCLGKMGEVAAGGRTVLLVSHNAYAIARLCRSGVVLENGKLVFTGPVQDALAAYHQLLAAPGDDRPELADRRLGNGDYRFEWVRPGKDAYRPDEEKVFRFALRRRRPAPYQLFLSAHVLDANGMVLVQCDSRLVGVHADAAEAVEGEFVLKTPWLKPGDYQVDFYCCGVSAGIVDWYQRACPLRVLPLPPYAHSAPDQAYAQGVVFGDFGWRLGG
jgi:lipopolysaccharide transport system ATP-binding protein